MFGGKIFDGLTLGYAVFALWMFDFCCAVVSLHIETRDLISNGWYFLECKLIYRS